MRRIFTVMAAVAVLTVMAAPASAQRQAGRFGRDLIGLMTNTSVQEELKLTDEQKEKVKKVADEVREKYGKDITQARTDMDREKAAKLQAEAREMALKALPDAIKADQLKRLKQIELQVRGLRALASEAVQKELKFTDKQKELIKTLSEETQKTREGLAKERRDAGDDAKKRDEIRKKMDDLSKDALAKASAALTSEQRKAWKEMTGEPFEVKFERRRPPQNQ
jgi:Spy/CpxP family protein refolding chaperone